MRLAQVTQLKAVLAVTILAQGEVLVTIVFFLATPRSGDDEYVRIVSGVAAQLDNIMQCKRTERALGQSQQRLSSLINSLPGIVFTGSNDPEWTMLYLSEGCLAVTGYYSQELAGSQRQYAYNEICHPDDLSSVLSSIEDAIAQQGPYVVEYRIRTKTGQEKWLWEKGHGLYDPNGAVLGIEGFITDITELKRAEAALKQAEEKYRSIFENAVSGIFQTTPEGHYLSANSRLAQIYGYDSPQALIASLTDIRHQLYLDPARRDEFSRLLQAQDAVLDFESQVYRNDGSVIWIAENARAMRDATGLLLGYEGTVEDITSRKHTEAELLKRDRLLQGVATAMTYLLTDINYEAAIAKVLDALGTAAVADHVYIYENHPHPDTGDMAMSLRYEWTRPSIQPTLQQTHWQNQPYSAFGLTRWYDALAKGESLQGLTQELPAAEQALLNLDRILSMLLVPILIDEQFWGFIGFDDCTTTRRWSCNEESILIAMAASIGGALKRQQAETTIRYQAFHDLLTGLPNRMLFNDRLPLALANAHRTKAMLAVMFLDLDRFKTINDTLGHAIGDQLLQAVATRLADCLREGDTIARWGGDEFTLLLPQISTAEDAIKAAQRIGDVLKPAFQLESHELYISSSIGIALYPHDGEDAQTLLRNADAALYRVKEQGRDGYQLYTPTINSQASALLALASDLHHALERHEFVLHYQPQINVVTGQITGMEALLRWQHPELGLVSPRTFIPLAEETGLILPIGEWVLRTACSQSKVWQLAGLPLRRMAINVSVRQFQQPHLVETIAQVLAETHLPPCALELEITETTAMQNVDFTIATLNVLQTLGVSISMDDFGTGYSSLGYLKRFPLNTIKLDQSFVHELTSNPHDAAIADAIIALGRGLHLNVVAEGVETQAQVDYLRSRHCDEMQGYLFSRPLPAAAATQFLQAHADKTLFTVL